MCVHPSVCFQGFPKSNVMLSHLHTNICFEMEKKGRINSCLLGIALIQCIPHPLGML